mmetsp:Transcript_13672/g.13391  ORF Transcript_13672/g.13391 Transcript_13672/m.13391 type:complete len:90 (+) Transcript_13672:113-382(+)|eukprot:CAMPEP_0170566328 /NCGR_PEP_ID=MMETSP0211-20121228/79767_1 /TAXON_ID=311385 /ORGANISM="Pseudokeronopsis sp., Strain OXSARD2" /LENGTH=89 /DNA_ID=CAMNT_0010887465 /DNA_START=109 /DNA_END=378 /DNA_ORIENTATION=-
MLAPSFMIKEMGKTPEFKSMYYEIFTNLNESIPTPEKGPLYHFYKNMGYEKKSHYHMKWNILTEEIHTEMDRIGQDDISFTFICKWFNI